jgi:hypothetical protein
MPLTSARHFENEAVRLKDKLAETPTEDGVLEDFTEELLLNLYETLSGNDLQALCESLKVIRYDKKQEDKKKFKQRKNRKNETNKKEKKPIFATEEVSFM